MCALPSPPPFFSDARLTKIIMSTWGKERLMCTNVLCLYKVRILATERKSPHLHQCSIAQAPFTSNATEVSTTTSVVTRSGAGGTTTSFVECAAKGVKPRPTTATTDAWYEEVQVRSLMAVCKWPLLMHYRLRIPPA